MIMGSKWGERREIIEKVGGASPLFWINDCHKDVADVLPNLPLSLSDIVDAGERLNRFAPLISRLFGETRGAGGIIESPLIPAPSLKERMSQKLGVDIKGRLFIKGDHALPIAGSVKARGGIYEVLHFAEALATENGLLKRTDPYLKILDAEVQGVFKKYTVSVGSTGNLGISVGVTAAALGLNGTVHMSSEAKGWKKSFLRERGVTVVEHEEDYTRAVKAGREAAANDPYTYFVDDESSIHLFLGYAVSALRLEHQLNETGLTVDGDHPLFVYIPCGVGGAPGGITFGLKHVFGDDVHSFFAEPVCAPAFLLGVLTDFKEGVSIYDAGLNNVTEADGLAVSSPSILAGSMVKNLVSGLFTVTDDDLFCFLHMLNASEGIRVEPSATAGFMGPVHLSLDNCAKDYIRENGLEKKMEYSVHILWSTGGSLVPEAEYTKFLERGREVDI
ncbi:MAG: D-serine ammonia-lyase [Deltaproteobacteria bacterium]|uniref:Probable D-serine dehydratase n=1 Tax=Candidatus Zymogenus saltonus TaxID=2844893 RepID=A0A9D8PP11_9DELT|nr:D-serine ammonia-lyase [Candidatus Zymogenus saltonus]